MLTEPRRTRSYVKALVLDFDGTLTFEGPPSTAVLDELERFRALGGRVILATGRTLEHLRQAFADVDVHFDMIVAENGAVLSSPDGEEPLVEAVDGSLHAALVERGVPCRRGQVLLATQVTWLQAVVASIEELGLETELLRNRGELMILPVGVSKATGVLAALSELRISRHNAVAIGDAENDGALFDLCEHGVAVANAVPALLAHADEQLSKADGEGVLEFLRGQALRRLRPPARARTSIPLGRDAAGKPVSLPAAPHNLLVCGAPHSGKSHVTGLVVEGLTRLGYATVVFDPEGDHVPLRRLPHVAALSGADVGLVVGLVDDLRESVVIDLSGVREQARRTLVRRFLASLEAHRSVHGVPHWIVLDEAHYYLAKPAGRRLVSTTRGGYCIVTYRPGELSTDLLAGMDAAILLPGSDPAECFPDVPQSALASVDALLGQADAGQAVLVDRHAPDLAPRLFRVGSRAVPHVRHWHKYVTELLPEHLRFVFRRPDGAPDGAPAGNLVELHRELERCEGAVIVDHARRGDFSRWSAEVLGDAELAGGLGAIEDALRAGRSAPEEARMGMLRTIERRYLD